MYTKPSHQYKIHIYNKFEFHFSTMDSIQMGCIGVTCNFMINIFQKAILNRALFLEQESFQDLKNQYVV
jgi:hypothetical protein